MQTKHDGHAPTGRRRLVILADGALLAEMNGQMKERDERFVDFLTIPQLVADALGGEVRPAKETNYFFQVGARAAEKFVASISSAWTVQSFPMRAFSASCSCGKSSVRFSSAIGWALGNVSGRGSSDAVVCVSSDPGLVMPIRFARDQGVDAYMAWMAPIGEEVRYFSARNDVPLLELAAADGQLQKSPDSFGQTFLKMTSSSSANEPGRPRSRRS
ncbi:MAG: hypothetical protein KDE27_21255 [Planctomycetes bacterium]|nr:hypothetical protein [Planctomycetota bacterium]